MHTRLFKVLMVLFVFPIVLPFFFTACSDDNPVAPVDNTIAALFMSDRDGTDRIYGMNASGSYQALLEPDTATYTDPAWSPDGSQFACARLYNGQWSLCAVSADGQTVTTLAVAASETRNPVWSPDGSRIAFEVGTVDNADIWAVNADGSSLTRVTNNPGSDLLPAWHPDGDMISYASYNTSTGSWETRWILADGSFTPAKIYTTNCGRESGWSPDGTWYFRVRPPEGGGGASILTEDNGAFAGSLTSADDINCLAWLPDGSALLMSLPPNFPGTYEILIWGPSGTWKELTDEAGNNTQPDCKENMTQILFCSDRDGNEEVYRMNFDGTRQYNMTKHSARDWGPKWRPGH